MPQIFSVLNSLQCLSQSISTKINITYARFFSRFSAVLEKLRDFFRYNNPRVCYFFVNRRKAVSGNFISYLMLFVFNVLFFFLMRNRCSGACLFNDIIIRVLKRLILKCMVVL